MSTTNSFLHAPNEVHFGDYKPEDVAEALDITEAQGWKNLRQILRIPASKRTFENTVLAFCRATESFDTVASLTSNLEAMMGDPWREVDALASQRDSLFGTKIFLDKRFYDALKEVKPITAAQTRLQEDLLRAYKRNGVELSPADQTKMKRLNRELNKASTKFGQNATKASDEAFLVVPTKAQLAGLDDEFIAACQKEAAKRDKKGFVIAFSEPIYAKVMNQCKVAKTRQRFYKLAMSRGKKYNAALVKKMLQLRQEKARLLGYANYGDYAAAERMAKTAATASSFLQDLYSRYQKRAWQEYEDLRDFAREASKDPGLELDISEIDTGLDWYWASQLRRQQFAVDEESLKSYFPLEAVLQGMFAAFTTLYGVRFAANTTQPVWHPDVKAYDLIDEQDRHIATVWCDWYARQGKSGGAWKSGYHVADRAGNKVEEPHLGFVCANFEPPVGDKPALLAMRDVETMWHEFGHFIHYALSSTELIEQNMGACKRDFIEAPSQIMENWVWRPEVLRTFARHYQTGELLSDELVAKLKAARTFRVASKAMRQLSLATVDMKLHTEYDPFGSQDPITFAQGIKSAFYPLPVAEFDANICTFGHIFAGGYSAGYYSYKWAEVIEADLFTRFEKEGALNPQTGRDYARKVLARGDEVDPEVLVHDFLGRPADAAAMLRRDGVQT